MLLLAEMGMPTSTMVFLGVVILVTSFLLIRTSRYFTRPKSPEPSWSSIARKSKDTPNHNPGIPREMANWEIEMHDFVREIKAELDSKMRALQAVTAEADRAAARLEAALKGSPNPSAVRVASNPPATDEEKPLRLPLRQAIGGEERGIDLSNLPSSQADSLSPSGVPQTSHSSAQAKKEEIYTYADYGMNSAEIANRVGHPIGEVELILSLRRK